MLSLESNLSQKRVDPLLNLKVCLRGLQSQIENQVKTYLKAWKYGVKEKLIIKLP